MSNLTKPAGLYLNMKKFLMFSWVICLLLMQVKRNHGQLFNSELLPANLVSSNLVNPKFLPVLMNTRHLLPVISSAQELLPHSIRSPITNVRAEVQSRMMALLVRFYLNQMINMGSSIADDTAEDFLKVYNRFIKVFGLDKYGNFEIKDGGPIKTRKDAAIQNTKKILKLLDDPVSKLVKTGTKESIRFRVDVLSPSVREFRKMVKEETSKGKMDEEIWDNFLNEIFPE